MSEKMTIDDLFEIKTAQDAKSISYIKLFDDDVSEYIKNNKKYINEIKKSEDDIEKINEIAKVAGKDFKEENFISNLNEYCINLFSDNNVKKNCINSVIDTPEGDFINELIQNADDCVAKKFEINFAEKYTEIYHDEKNEEGMSLRDIFAISTVFRSTKAGDSNTIGEKGRGFKSVFKTYKTVDVVSGKRRFTLFDDGFKIKELENDDMPKEEINGTRMRFYCKEGQYPEGIYNLIAKKFGIIGCSLDKTEIFSNCPLLFTNHLKKLTVKVDGKERFTISVSPEENEIVVEKDGQKTTINFVSYSKKTTVNGTEYDIKIVGSDDDIKNGKLYCFLPTHITINAPFNIHMPFKLVSDRSALSFGNENDKKWNTTLLRNLNSLITGFYDKLDENKYKYIPFLYSEKGEPNNFFGADNNIASAQLEKLNETTESSSNLLYGLKTYPYFKINKKNDFHNMTNALLFDKFFYDNDVADEWKRYANLEKKDVVIEYQDDIEKYASRIGFKKYDYDEWPPYYYITSGLNSLMKAKDDEFREEVRANIRSLAFYDKIKDRLYDIEIFPAISKDGEKFLNGKGLWIYDSWGYVKVKTGDYGFHFTGKDFPGSCAEIEPYLIPYNAGEDKRYMFRSLLNFLSKPEHKDKVTFENVYNFIKDQGEDPAKYTYSFKEIIENSSDDKNPLLIKFKLETDNKTELPPVCNWGENANWQDLFKYINEHKDKAENITFTPDRNFFSKETFGIKIYIYTNLPVKYLFLGDKVLVKSEKDINEILPGIIGADEFYKYINENKNDLKQNPISYNEDTEKQFGHMQKWVIAYHMHNKIDNRGGNTENSINDDRKATSENIPEYELLQNADDSKRRNRKENDGIGNDFNIKKSESENKIVLSYSEAGFTLWDFYCIIAMGNTANEGMNSNTGKFGTGFKSIYKKCKKVEIISHDIKCELDTEYIPEDLEKITDIRERLSIFPVPKFSKIEGREKNNITEIHLYFKDNKLDEFYRIITLPSKYVFLKDIDYPFDTNPFEDKSWLFETEKYQFYFPPKPNEDWSFYLYCNLPMEGDGVPKLPFMVNIPDIHTTEDRKRIKEYDYYHNGSLLKNLPNAIKNAFEKLVRKSEKNALDYFSRTPDEIVVNGTGIRINKNTFKIFKSNNKNNSYYSINELDGSCKAKVFTEELYSFINNHNVADKITIEYIPPEIAIECELYKKVTAPYETILDKFNKENIIDLETGESIFNNEGFAIECLPHIRQKMYYTDDGDLVNTGDKLLNLFKDKKPHLLSFFNGEFKGNSTYANKMFEAGFVAFKTKDGIRIGSKNETYYYSDNKNYLEKTDKPEKNIIFILPYAFRNKDVFGETFIDLSEINKASILDNDEIIADMKKSINDKELKKTLLEPFVFGEDSFKGYGKGPYQNYALCPVCKAKLFAGEDALGVEYIDAVFDDKEYSVPMLMCKNCSTVKSYELELPKKLLKTDRFRLKINNTEEYIDDLTLAHKLIILKEIEKD